MVLILMLHPSAVVCNLVARGRRIVGARSGLQPGWKFQITCDRPTSGRPARADPQEIFGFELRSLVAGDKSGFTLMPGVRIPEAS
jgi:hypothetical protein